MSKLARVSSPASSPSKRVKRVPIRHKYDVYINKIGEEFNTDVAKRLTHKSMPLEKLCKWCSSELDKTVENHLIEMQKTDPSYSILSMRKEVVFVLYNVDTKEANEDHVVWEDIVDSAWMLRINERADADKERDRRRALRAENGDDACSDMEDETHPSLQEEEDDDEYVTSDEESDEKDAE